MKILALTSSFRKRGNTARIVEMVGEHLKTIGAREGHPVDFEVLYLGELDVRPCRGCRTCFDRGEARCPQQDDVAGIKAKVDAADGVIFASPVYVNDVNGVAKTLLDRLAYVCHRPQFAGKCAYLIATVAAGPTNYALRILNLAALTWGFHIVGQAGLKMGALMPDAEVKSRYTSETAQVAETLFRAVAHRHALDPSFLSLMTFRIQQLAWRRSPDDSLDYAHWKGQGWLEPRRTFYIEHRAGPVKVALARLAGTVLNRFVA